MGFCQYREQNRCDRLPRMMGFQAAGSAPLVKGEVVTRPETIATAIRIGHPANWQRAIAVKEASQGAFNAVTDEEILQAYYLLASEEGIFCEPASAASVAGLLKLADQVPSGATVVCVLTGKWSKDPDTALKQESDRFHRHIPATEQTVAKVMGF